ncbi:SMC-Scp complex subunit ScpB [Schlesneria paludicola]|uniref:SMC-Scp complex subunit ScpB n=1 Tax=Schlesneria paludicola TaxID=360056 RepID=UPI0012FAD2DE|nr:SMC-Scp complex subunit ScpB [Schlesneria paludicola]
MSSLGSGWGRASTGWKVIPYDGHRWAFFSRGGDDAAAIIVISGTHPACVRTPKMARVEAVLFVADVAISAKRLSQLATLADTQEANRLIEQLNAAYDLDDSAYRIERVASGYRMLTKPAFAFWLGKLHQRQAELKLTPPALETLAIVAYRQPVTRADVEAIRRVQCADLLKYLMERGLVRIAGEHDSLGRPFLYETTRQFLELFGLRGLDALPMADALRPRDQVAAARIDADEGDAESSESAA